MQNSNNIHFFFNNELLLFTQSVDKSSFRRRYLGRHIAFHLGTKEVESDFFDEVVYLHINTFQKICFSPILGDEVALNMLALKLKSHYDNAFQNCFNLFGHPACSSLANLFESETKIGFQTIEGNEICSDNLLRFLKLYRKIDQGEDFIHKSLIQKSLKQFDQESLKNSFGKTIEHKFQSHKIPLKKVIILNKVKSESAIDEKIVKEVSNFFSVINDQDYNCNEYYPDAIMSSHPSEGIDVSTLDPEEVLGRISISISSSINSWFMRNIFIDYLGLTKTSFSVERLISTYPKEILQEFLLLQVSQLKEMVGCLVASERQKNPELAKSAVNVFSQQNTPLGMALIIHLSQNNSNNSNSDVESLKNRLRSLNSLYERIFRLCSIELPKNDLALTL